MSPSVRDMGGFTSARPDAFDPASRIVSLAPEVL